MLSAVTEGYVCGTSGGGLGGGGRCAAACSVRFCDKIILALNSRFCAPSTNFRSSEVRVSISTTSLRDNKVLDILRQNEDYMEGHPAGADIAGVLGYCAEQNSAQTANSDSCWFSD